MKLLVTDKCVVDSEKEKQLVSVHLLTDGQVSAMLTTVTTTGTSKCLRQTEDSETPQLENAKLKDRYNQALPESTSTQKWSI